MAEKKKRTKVTKAKATKTKAKTREEVAELFRDRLAMAAGAIAIAGTFKPGTEGARTYLSRALVMLELARSASKLAKS